MKLICPNCGSKYDSGKFCLACGSPLSEVVVKKVLFCPVCQTEETSGKFCTTCGSKLEEREIEIAGDNYSQTTNTEKSPVNDTQMDDEVEAIVAKYRDEHGNIRKLNPEEYPIAAEELQRCASKGNLEAICFLAELYLKGFGVPKDPDQAFKLFSEAEQKGSKYATIAIGEFYMNGEIVEQDRAEGYRRLIDGYNHLKVPVIAGELALCYYLDEEYENALKYARLAADAEEEVGYLILGNLYLHGLCVEQDNSKAFEYFMQSAAQGNFTASNQIGWMYSEGCGVEENPEQAFFWYNESAQKGHPRGMNNLAYCYQKGYGVTQDFEKAAEWYKKSADLGIVESMIELADYYEEVLVDYKKAKVWVEKAAEAGNAEAINRLGVIYLDREKNYNEAIKCFNRAIELEVPNAYRNLALCYRDGTGVKKNLKKAEELLLKAAQLGIDDADEIRTEMLKSVEQPSAKEQPTIKTDKVEVAKEVPSNSEKLPTPKKVEVTEKREKNVQAKSSSGSGCFKTILICILIIGGLVWYFTKSDEPESSIPEYSEVQEPEYQDFLGYMDWEYGITLRLSSGEGQVDGVYNNHKYESTFLDLRGTCTGSHYNLTLYKKNGSEMGTFTLTRTGKSMLGNYHDTKSDTDHRVEISCDPSNPIPYQEDPEKVAQREQEELLSQQSEEVKNPNGHSFVDLGLPSGLCWAACNLGAPNAMDMGSHFSWGETSDKYEYSQSSYSCDLGVSMLSASYDAATVLWGGSWRTPTSEEWQELNSYCEWSWQGAGYAVKGPSGKSIFLPAAGYSKGSTRFKSGERGDYWTSTPFGSDKAYEFVIKEDAHQVENDSRHYGLSIRPVF